MANPAIGYVTCRHCGEQARVTESKKGHLCITCPDGCAQEFTRNASSTAKVRAAMKPAQEKNEHEQADKPAAEKPAAKPVATDDRGTEAAPARRRRFGLG